MEALSGASNLTARCFSDLDTIRTDESMVICAARIGQMSIRPRLVAVAFVKAVVCTRLLRNAKIWAGEWVSRWTSERAEL